MLPYYLLLLLPLILKFVVSLYNSRQADIICIYSFFIFLFFLLALRSVDVGIDLHGYESYFNLVAVTPWSKLGDVSTFEYGYVILNKLISLVFGFRGFLIIVALLSLSPIMRLFLRYPDYSYLSVILFLNLGTFPMLFSGLRQDISIGLGICAYLCLIDKKTIRSICFCFLALFFHTSSFILFSLFLFYNLKKLKKKWLLVLLLVLIVFLFEETIFSFLLGRLPDKYASYGMTTRQTSQMLFLFLLLYVFTLLVLDTKKIHQDIIGMQNILVLVIIIQVFASISSIAMRMNYYFIPLVPCLISQTVTNPLPKYRRLAHLASYVLILFFIFWFLYSAYTGEDILEIFPYKKYL